MCAHMCALCACIPHFLAVLWTHGNARRHTAEWKNGHTHRENCPSQTRAVGTQAITGGGDMALSDAKLRALKPAEKIYQAADEGGLSLVIHPGGTKTWQYRYRIGGRGAKQEKVTLGNYPDFPLADARAWRDDCRGLVQRGVSPMALRRGDPTPATASPAVMEMAQAFRAAWCGDVMARERAEEAKAQAASTVQAFAEVWYSEMVEPANSNPRNIRRVLDKDVIPAIGGKQVSEVTVTDVLAITDRIKDRGADQMALATRNVLKRLFSYAIAREVADRKSVV